MKPAMISCEELLRELSNYLDDAVDPQLRAAIEAHLRGCKRCSVLVDTTRRSIRIIADERVMTIPLDYSERLRAFLDSRLPPAGAGIGQ